jgi:NAD(P)-dependent dehydrogenase (short-subunit alcohol dehydrogenase family)
VAGDNVLVTGASGFVGSAVAHALIRSGYRVRALLRPTSKRTNLAGLDVEIVEGDMRDAALVARAMCSMSPPTIASLPAIRKKLCGTTGRGLDFLCKRHLRRKWSASSIRAVPQPSRARRVANRPTRRCG